MKVKELIELLNKCEPEMFVYYLEHDDTLDYARVDTVEIRYDDNSGENVVLLIDDIINMF